MQHMSQKHELPLGSLIIAAHPLQAQPARSSYMVHPHQLPNTAIEAAFHLFAPAFLLQAQAAFPDLAKGAGAVQRALRILDHQPEVDPSSSAGVTVELEGKVELRRVTFAYPARPQRLILKEFSLTVAAGSSCALVSGWVAARPYALPVCKWVSVPACFVQPCRFRLLLTGWKRLAYPHLQVGESGHGKSTILGLLERFYEPVDGQVGCWLWVVVCWACCLHCLLCMHACIQCCHAWPETAH